MCTVVCMRRELNESTQKTLVCGFSILRLSQCMCVSVCNLFTNINYFFFAFFPYFSWFFFLCVLILFSICLKRALVYALFMLVFSKFSYWLACWMDGCFFSARNLTQRTFFTYFFFSFSFTRKLANRCKRFIMVSVIIFEYLMNRC